jgi:hypothetical protein
VGATRTGCPPHRSRETRASRTCCRGFHDRDRQLVDERWAPDPHRDALARLRRELVAEQLVEEVEIRRLGARRLGEHSVETFSHVPEIDAAQVLDDACVDDFSGALTVIHLAPGM